MAFIFNMRSTTVNGPNGANMQRGDLSPTGTLPAIDENQPSFSTTITAPPVPPRAWNRPSRRSLGLGYGLALDSDPEGSPPAYDSRGVGGEKLAELRHGLENNRHIAKRGGWKKILIVVAVLLLIIIGLVVGLVVGLHGKNKGDSSSSSSASSSSASSSTSGGASGSVEPPPASIENPSPSLFPLGSYRINTYLSTIATNCTSNPATWQCYPYRTYAQSPSSSAAAFDWIISPGSGPDTYNISSTQNIFSILFTNATLTLRNAGKDDEHYFFQFRMSKPTKPTQQIGSENVAATCYFDNTTMQGNLYTKMAKTYPKSDADEGGSYEPWPYAAKIEQVTAAGPGMPKCQDASGASLGDFSVDDGTQLCDCLYLNTGT